MKAEWTNKDSLTSCETTKAILVIDMPKNCSKCKLSFLQGIGEGICNAVDWEERPSWCPLRPLPEKKEAYALSYTERAYEFTAKTHPLYADGWNDCLDEIIGETE